MDDLSCSGEVVDQSLKELDFINRWLGGNPVTLDGVDRLLAQHKLSSYHHLHLADIGCGSGTILNQIAASLTKKNIPFTLTGVDANPNIIAYAANTFSNNPSIAFRAENIFEDSFNTFQL